MNLLALMLNNISFKSMLFACYARGNVAKKINLNSRQKNHVCTLITIKKKSAKYVKNVIDTKVANSAISSLTMSYVNAHRILGHLDRRTYPSASK